MFLFVFALSLVGQINHIELKGSGFRIESAQPLHISKHELPETKKQKKRIYFDIKPAVLGPKVPSSIVSKHKAISKIRIAQHAQEVVRVVAEVVGNPQLSMKQSDSPVSQGAEDKKAFKIVLDPGHGGEDPGAIGRYGLREKDVTLSVAKQVKKYIEKNMPGVEVLLTRDHDKTLSLPSRTEFANHAQADLFISIHVNASPNRDTQGIETYYLNITHDRYALRLAARENAMTESETSNLEYILADLAMKSSVGDSVRLGNLVQENLCDNLARHWNHITNLGLKQAMFYVLMGAKMPAILVETSFISNKTEERRLQKESYQKALAEGIVRGIQRYSQEKVALR